MIKKYTLDGLYSSDPKNFGGLIYPIDFDTYRKPIAGRLGSDLAGRILSDYRFDMNCRKATIIRDRGR